MIRVTAVTLAVTAASLAAASPAPAAPPSAVQVVRVSAPASLVPGRDQAITVRVRNPRATAVRGLVVSVRYALPPGAAVPLVVGRTRVARLAARAAVGVRVVVRLPASAPRRTARLVACTSPAVCGTSPARRVVGDTAVERIAAAVARGRLSEGRGLLFQLYAVTGDARLPKAYRGEAGVEAGSLLQQAAVRLPSLPAAEQAALRPFLLPPQVAGSAWAGRAPGRLPRADGECAPVAAGLWEGIATTHALVWHRPGDAAGRASAARYAAVVDGIYAKLTGAFRVPVPDGTDPCDPTKDARLDIYVVRPGPDAEPLRGAGGVAPPYPQVQGADPCGPRASFIVLPPGRPPTTVAHELMHVIQWAYRACQRSPMWVEGIATWAEDLAFPRSRDKHQFRASLVTPFVSLDSPLIGTGSGAGYEAWTFWYSLVKKAGGPAPVKAFLEAAGGGTAAAMQAIDAEGFRGAWKRYAVERWNQTPIGASGFPVGQSFRAWDGLAAHQSEAASEPVVVKLDGQDEAFFALQTDIQERAATWFNRVRITDRKVRQIEITNRDHGKPNALVQAFLRLQNGTWRLEDWSDRQRITLCRDRAAQNVTELIVASSNAAVGVPSLGVVQHRLVAKDTCDQEDAFFKLDSIGYQANHTASILGNPFPPCSISGTATETFSTTAVPFNSELAHLRFDRGSYQGGIGFPQAFTGARSSEITGCAGTDPFPACTVASQINPLLGFGLAVSIPEDAEEATILWALPVAQVGSGIPPGPDCYAPYMTATGDVLETKVPRETFLDPGMKEVTGTRQIAISGTVFGLTQTMNGTSTLTLRFHRVNRDGSPYTG